MTPAQALILAAVLIAAGVVLVQAMQAQSTGTADAGAGVGGGDIEPGAGPDAEPAAAETIAGAIMSRATSFLELWRPPAQYAAAIQAAEDTNGIPRDILARLLYQECRWRQDIITGRTRSPVGAMGIAQFMPATAQELGIDPLDPYASIAAAGVYLARLYRQTGTWMHALAAYNWGIGNVRRKGIAAAPAETRNYYAAILGDVNQSNGTSYA